MLIKLIPALPQYAELMMKWRQEPLSVAYNPLRPQTIETFTQHLAECASDLTALREGVQYRWAVELNGELVGSVALMEVNLAMGTAMIGYSIGAAWHGRGVGTAAVRALVDAVFRDTRLRRLMAYVHEENLASRRLIEKVGFRQEGLLREHYVVNGQPVNEALYAVLRREWSKDSV